MVWIEILYTSHDNCVLSLFSISVWYRFGTTYEFRKWPSAWLIDSIEKSILSAATDDMSIHSLETAFNDLKNKTEKKVSDPRFPYRVAPIAVFTMLLVGRDWRFVHPARSGSVTLLFLSDSSVNSWEMMVVLWRRRLLRWVLKMFRWLELCGLDEALID